MPKDTQRDVKDLDWVGWNPLKSIVEKAKGASFETGDEAFKRHMARGLLLVGFKTGGRITEFIPLTRDKFSFEGEFWTVTLPLVKRYRKTKEVKKWKCVKCDRRWKKKPGRDVSCPIEGSHEFEKYDGYETKSLEKTRTVEFPADEPLSEEMKEWVEGREDLLFPHPYDETVPMRRSYAYTLIVGVDPDIWPHWLRAQRACQLSDEADFTLEERQDWFEWKDDEYPRYYGSRKYEMREKMSKPKRRIM